MITAAERERFEQRLRLEERSAATVRKYCRDVDAFLSYAGGGELSKESAISYKQWLLERYAPTSVNSMLAALNRFFREIGRYDCVVRAVRIQRQAFRGRERELSKAEYFRFACLYYKAEKDLSHLADILGHSSLNTTRIYTSLSGEERQRQIDRLGLVVT